MKRYSSCLINSIILLLATICNFNILFINAKPGCVRWRQTGGCSPDGPREPGGDRGCKSIVPPGASGFCECENGRRAGASTCDHDKFTCFDVCVYGEMDFMEGSVWYWNDWRDVEFREDHTFYAPDGNCDHEECTWRAEGGFVIIDWGNAGTHKVKLSNDRKRLTGERVRDGDPCHADIRKEGAKKKEEMKGEIKKNEDGTVDPEHWITDLEDDDYDPYLIIGVDPDDDDGKIKKAFRKLSRKWHPDKIRGDSKKKEKAKKIFEHIRTAYEIIGDKDKRMMFDTGGMELVKESDKKEQGGGAMDPFAAFFGGGGNQRGNRGNDANVDLTVSLDDMYNGNEISAEITRRVICRGCKNKPKRGKCAKCDRCPNEIKMVTRTMGPGFQVQQQQEVPSKHRCKNEPTTLATVIEKGMADGSTIKFERMSEQRPGQIPGDVIMRLRQKKHRLFNRDGNDLKMEMTITLKEALLGFTKTITHMDEHTVEISRKRITKPFFVKTIKGEGMPIHQFPSEFGDLHVKFIVEMPKQLNDAQKKFVEENF